jgi:exonuclease V gamma subunit
LISRLLTIDKSRVAATIRTSWAKLKVQNPESVCEVMNRVDRREDIFQSDDDRRLFLETLGQAFE